MKRIKNTLLTLLITAGVSSTAFAATPTQTQTVTPATQSTSQAIQQPAIATVNVNTATVEQLSTLKGIGPAKAKAIVQFREEYGTFNSLDDLASVKGIGSKTIEKNRLLATAQ